MQSKLSKGDVDKIEARYKQDKTQAQQDSNGEDINGNRCPVKPNPCRNGGLSNSEYEMF